MFLGAESFIPEYTETKLKPHAIVAVELGSLMNRVSRSIVWTTTTMISRRPVYIIAAQG